MPLPLAQPIPSNLPGQQTSRLQANCHACGFQNLNVDVRCQKCGRRLQPAQAPAPVAETAAPQVPAALEVTLPPAAPPRPAMPDHVRSEIHSRVERFKARRRAQTLPLPFEEQVLPEEDNVVAFPTLESEAAPKPARGRASRPVKISGPAAPAPLACAEPAGLTTGERNDVDAPLAAPVILVAPLEIPATSLAQFAAAALEPVAPPARHAAEPLAVPVPAPPPVQAVPQFPLFIPPAEQPEAEWSNFQIASLGKRLSGIGHDLANILGGVLLFAAPFYWIAGKPHFNLSLLAAFICGALIISLLYGTLFMAVLEETPGMTAAGLRVVSFSGHKASWQQRMLRVAGALVSAGSFLFGYLWACIDEEKLYWHDHISKTVLTDSTK